MKFVYVVFSVIEAKAKNKFQKKFIRDNVEINAREEDRKIIYFYNLRY